MVRGAAGVVAAEGGMVGIVVAMDSKETVIIDNHHGWSENNRPFLLPCTNLWLTLYKVRSLRPAPMAALVADTMSARAIPY